MKATTIRDSWYVIFPEGSAWVAVKIDSGGTGVCQQVEESDAETHIAANDRWAKVVRAIHDGDVDVDVDPEAAAAVIAAWSADARPENCVVERLVGITA